MTNNFNQDLKSFLCPYAFVLTEGQEIQSDSLDYSLCMVQLGLAEKISSPAIPESESVTDFGKIFLHKVVSKE